MKIHPDPRATAHSCRICREAITAAAAPTPVHREPCRHQGAEVRQVGCQGCNGTVRLKVLRRAVHAECTPATAVRGVSCCLSCPDWTPRTVSRVVPQCGGKTNARWQGVAEKKSWQYRVTAVLPHLETPDLLAVLVQLLRLQTDQPYILVIDTGSSESVCNQLELIRADDVEVHYLRSHGYCHPSEPVCAALDLGLALANTDLIFHTHTDCFPTKRTSVEWLAGQCSSSCPVVGWEMSERSWATTEWIGMVSHTFTMLHAPTLRKIGASWNLQRGRELFGYDRFLSLGGWPDTETAFGAVVRTRKSCPSS